MAELTAQLPKIQKQAIPGVQHVFLIDWDDNGMLREVAVVSETPDGTIRGILVDQLHAIDRRRLQRFITSQHADKYPLWELLSNGKLNNGMNALDFFHWNYVKEKRPRGSIMGGSFGTVSPSIKISAGGVDEQQIGQTSSASLARPGEY